MASTPLVETEARPIRLPSLLVVIAIGVAVRLVLAAIVGPNIDETYIAVISRAPALGYVDHPPMAMWIAAAIRWLTGSENFFLLRLPFIALFAGTTWLVHGLTKFLFGHSAALIAVVALSLTPLISIYFGTFVLTDGPFVFFLTAAAFCTARALFSGAGARPTLWWLASGALLGLAMLSKYTAVFLPLGLGLYLLTQPHHRHWLLRPAPWAALVLAALVFSPVVIWNAGHGWISFAFQGNRAAPGLTLEPVRLVVNLAIQSFYFLPPIWVGLMLTLGRGLRAGPADQRSWFTACLAVGPIVFFALVWLVARQNNQGFHWAAPGFLMLYPLYGFFVAERSRIAPREVAWWFGGSAAVLAVLLVGYLTYATTGWGQVFMADRTAKDPVLADQVAWRDLGSALAAKGLTDPARYFLVATNWQQCVRIDYGVGGALPVVCVTDDPLLAFEANAGVTSGKDAIIVSLSPALEGLDAALAKRFGAVEPLGAVPITTHGVRALTVWLFLGRGSAPAPSG